MERGGFKKLFAGGEGLIFNRELKKKFKKGNFNKEQGRGGEKVSGEFVTLKEATLIYCIRKCNSRNVVNMVDMAKQILLFVSRVG